MTPQIFTVNSRKYDFSLHRSWKASLLMRSEDRLTLEGVFEEEIRHPDLGQIRKGTRSVETFVFGHWYNLFAFYEPTGAFRNYYFNVSMPPVIGGPVADYVDLDIDVIVWPDGQIEVLDLREFEENSRLYCYPPVVIETALTTKAAIVADPYRFINPSLPLITNRP